MDGSSFTNWYTQPMAKVRITVVLVNILLRWEARECSKKYTAEPVIIWIYIYSCEALITAPDQCLDYRGVRLNLVLAVIALIIT